MRGGELRADGDASVGTHIRAGHHGAWALTREWGMTWISDMTARISAASGIDARTLTIADDDATELLRLAGVAAHTSGDRTNAPLLCHVLGRAVALGAARLARARRRRRGRRLSASTPGARRDRAVEVAGPGGVVWRGRSGRLGSAPRFCPHLDHDLAEGYVSGDELVCAGHGWAFDGAGPPTSATSSAASIPRAPCSRWC